MLELKITNKDYDFLGMETQISEYCRKNQIAPKLENRTQLAFEELVEQLMRHTVGLGHIETVLEYSEVQEQMTMIVRADGPEPKDSPDEENLSVKLIRSAITDVEYSREEGSDLPNKLVLHIKSEN